jgi:hypothetical protein
LDQTDATTDAGRIAGDSATDVQKLLQQLKDLHPEDSSSNMKSSSSSSSSSSSGSTKSNGMLEGATDALTAAKTDTDSSQQKTPGKDPATNTHSIGDAQPPPTSTKPSRTLADGPPLREPRARQQTMPSEHLEPGLQSDIALSQSNNKGSRGRPESLAEDQNRPSSSEPGSAAAASSGLAALDNVDPNTAMEELLRIEAMLDALGVPQAPGYKARPSQAPAKPADTSRTRRHKGFIMEAGEVPKFRSGNVNTTSPVTTGSPPVHPVASDELERTLSARVHAPAEITRGDDVHPHAGKTQLWGGRAVILSGQVASVTGLRHRSRWGGALVEFVAQFDGSPLSPAESAALFNESPDTPYVTDKEYSWVFDEEGAYPVHV